MPGSLHYVEPWVPDLGRACGPGHYAAGHYAAYLANTDGFEVELVAGEA
jgi:hypothetical protein